MLDTGCHTIVKCRARRGGCSRRAAAPLCHAGATKSRYADEPPAAAPVLSRPPRLRLLPGRGRVRRPGGARRPLDGPGDRVVALDAQYLEVDAGTHVACIPYHRVRRILYDGDVIWTREA